MMIQLLRLKYNPLFPLPLPLPLPLPTLPPSLIPRRCELTNWKLMIDGIVRKGIIL
jgi:hypothetical protein